MRSRLLSTRRTRLVALGAIAVLLAGVAIASAALNGAGQPPPRPLAVAVHDALTAPAVPGVTARITFTNHLVSSGTLPRGMGSPLLAGATGRAWVAADGRFRLELQSSGGDDQIVSDGRTLTLYEGKSNTLYTAALPRHGHERQGGHESPPTLADVRRGLARLSRHARVSGATPTNVAGQPAYSVTVSPAAHGGRLGGLSAAWDAARGVPLRLAVTARGSSSPVLELEATDISYGTVPASALRAPTPAGAKHRRVELPAAAGPARSGRHPEVTGAAAVRRAAGFPVAAPARLAGLRRQEVRLIGPRGGHRAVLALYGHGLDGFALLQARAAGGRDAAFRGLQTVAIGGATGRELPTALGTVVRWSSGGVTSTLAGSQPAGAVEAAARQIAAR